MTKETLRKPFSASRITLLARNRAYEDFPALVIGAGILSGINLLFVILGKRAIMNDSGGQSWTMAICLAGILLSGAAFKGMHDGRSGTDWILLPATSLEKYTSGLFFYLFIFPLASAVAATGLSAIFSLAELASGGPGGRIWNPLSAVGLRGWFDYATVAVVFAAGSAAFRKRAFIKTFGLVVAYFLVAAGILLAAVLVVRKLGGLPVPDLVFDNGDLRMAGDLSFKAQPAVDTLLNIVRYALIPVFALLYGYFRVAEKEARDEVQ